MPGVVMATMTSSRCRRAALVLLLAVAVVSCRRRDAAQDDDARSATLDRLLEPSAAAAARRHRDGHLPSAGGGDKRGWRDNRVRVWGKRTAVRHADDDDDKRSWHQNTVRVWGKRRGAAAAAAADRRSWAGNTIRVWGKRLDLGGPTPEQVLDRYGAAPKRSTGGGGASTLRRGLSRGGTPAGDELTTTRSKRSPSYGHHAGRWVVRRSVGHGPRWVAFRGPKRSWRTNVIRVWGKRAA